MLITAILDFFFKHWAKFVVLGLLLVAFFWFKGLKEEYWDKPRRDRDNWRVAYVLEKTAYDRMKTAYDVVVVKYNKAVELNKANQRTYDAMILQTRAAIAQADREKMEAHKRAADYGKVKSDAQSAPKGDVWPVSPVVRRTVERLWPGHVVTGQSKAGYAPPNEGANSGGGARPVPEVVHSTALRGPVA